MTHQLGGLAARRHGEAQPGHRSSQDGSDAGGDLDLKWADTRLGPLLAGSRDEIKGPMHQRGSQPAPGGQPEVLVRDNPGLELLVGEPDPEF